MSTVLTKFEIRLPLDDGNGTSIDTAVETFLNALKAITPYTFQNVYQNDASGTQSQYNLTFGLVTNAQAVNALALLNTLNTALGTPVVCYSYPVTMQP
jgi:hypothetical protein